MTEGSGADQGDVSRYTERGVEEDKDPLAPLRRAMGGIAGLAQALTRP